MYYRRLLQRNFLHIPGGKFQVKYLPKSDVIRGLCSKPNLPKLPVTPASNDKIMQDIDTKLKRLTLLDMAIVTVNSCGVILSGLSLLGLYIYFCHDGEDEYHKGKQWER